VSLATLKKKKNKAIYIFTQSNTRSRINDKREEIKQDKRTYDKESEKKDETSEL
jgi:hypothetical protein